MSCLAYEHRDWPLEVRFYWFVKKTKSCWLWTGAKSQGKYGKIHNGETIERAHRVSYRIHHGEVPEGHFIRQSCKNPKCVNPDHLILRKYKRAMI